MEYRIETLCPKQLVGMHMGMSYINNKTAELWRTFMPIRNQVKNRVDQQYYSMQIYQNTFELGTFNPSKLFTKWAAVEVAEFESIPSGMDQYMLNGGLYAVFIHHGPASEFEKSFRYIFEQWLPNSDYEMDDREHFELLQEGYNPMDVNAIEEIWVPIVCKKTFKSGLRCELI